MTNATGSRAPWRLPKLSSIPEPARTLVRKRYNALTVRSWVFWASLAFAVALYLCARPFKSNLSEAVRPLPPVVRFLVTSAGVPSAAVVLFVLPVVPTLRKNYRRALRENGRCPACGSDLRASPDRCPACGAVVAAKGVE
jgi:hypothetical protein